VVDKSLGGRVFDGVIITVLLIFGLITIVPFIHVIAASFASQKAYMESTFMLFPTEFSLNAYKYIFSTDVLTRSLLTTICITAVGTMINLIMTSLLGYSLSRNNVHFKKTIMFMIVFTMIFQGGMIPLFLIVKSLGMLNSYWSLLLPSAISPFLLIVLINFFKNLPDGLEESAKIDGCGDLRLLLQIVLPLSKPALATLTLFYAVGHWNTYMSALLYLNDSKMWPIQVLLRQIVLVSQAGLAESSVQDAAEIAPDTVRMAVITVATFPILCIYPFLQKHFAKGMLLGSVKG
jgi:putative aldouronate transport system permease protein